MNTRWKLGVAVLVGAAIAVPATVIARGAPNATGPADNFQTASVANVSTNSKSYQPVGLVLPETGADIGVTVSAQMTKGKAKFRVVGASQEAAPASVQFSGKAANAFLFGATASCPQLHVEWKRVGDAKAEAAQVSYLAVYDQNACV